MEGFGWSDQAESPDRSSVLCSHKLCHSIPVSGKNCRYRSPLLCGSFSSLQKKRSRQQVLTRTLWSCACSSSLMNSAAANSSFLGRTTSTRHLSSVQSPAASSRHPTAARLLAIPVELADTDRMGQCTGRHLHCAASDKTPRQSSDIEHRLAMRETAVADSSSCQHHRLVMEPPLEHLLPFEHPSLKLGALVDIPVDNPASFVALDNRPVPV